MPLKDDDELQPIEDFFAADIGSSKKKQNKEQPIQIDQIIDNDLISLDFNNNSRKKEINEANP